MALTTNTALAQLQPSGIRRITDFAKQTPGCILLTLGEPDGNTADVVKEEVAKSLAANETHYPPNNGTVELRRAISAHMEKRNLAYGEDEIIAPAARPKRCSRRFRAFLILAMRCSYLRRRLVCMNRSSR